MAAVASARSSPARDAAPPLQTESIEPRSTEDEPRFPEILNLYDDTDLDDSSYKAPVDSGSDTRYFDMMIESILCEGGNIAQDKRGAVVEEATVDSTQDLLAKGALNPIPAIEGHEEPVKELESWLGDPVYTPPDSDDDLNQTKPWKASEVTLASPSQSTQLPKDIVVEDTRASEDETTPMEDSMFEIERLSSHQVEKKTSIVDFQVEWVGGVLSWETERDIQLQVPKLVLDYWDKQGGRQKATGLDEFHVLRLLRSRGRLPHYQVQWVGYRRSVADTTWETREFVKRIAPNELDQFEAKQDAAKKRHGATGPGRPRKKSKSKP